ncbi:L,D-transpeptidase family protein [Aliamphritea ceti]|uniref:L,D-transpeptidase family protein n=1 Tax=Aliamphritea ceti TaxID=1524258 RepID=UPI0021C4C368|nr:L,D-transpeptidase family protein [Aliamphritea ceti]
MYCRAFFYRTFFYRAFFYRTACPPKTDHSDLFSHTLSAILFLFLTSITASVNASSRPAITPLDTEPYSFKELQQAIGFYQTLNTLPWPVLRKTNKLLRLEDNHPDLAIMRHQLLLLGDLTAPYTTPHNTSDNAADTDTKANSAEYFDQHLEQALKHFQQRHGIKVDGILGPQSRKALNISPAHRIQQLALNIHRQNQFADKASQRFIQVNIPEFRLRLFDQNELLLEMKTIVGRKTRKTPVFDTHIQALVINPSWNVPKSIAFKDILPRWQEDPEYLQRKNLQVLAGWNSSRPVPAEEIDLTKMYQGNEYQRLWEPPGMGNTLGRIKFISRSQYAIYLHDTSAPRLFDEHNRAFSSGCIRVAEARQLADTLLSLSEPEDVSLEPILSHSRTQTLPLQQPVNLHVTYWTAWISPKGTLNFREDLYKRDRWQMQEHQQQLAEIIDKSSVPAPLETAQVALRQVHQQSLDTQTE